jgi:hypothetical protein
MIVFSNPRLSAEFDDWPSGSVRVKCKFQVEQDPKRGWRVSRTTTDKHGTWCKPKVTTYGGPAVIVDGSDGRTYILQICGSHGFGSGGFINVKRSDFFDASAEMDGNAAVFKQERPELYRELSKIIKVLP